MKFEKKLILYFIVFINIVFTNVFSYPNKTSDFYINDFAQVLNQETKDYILSHSRALDLSTTAQIVVTTLTSLEGKTEYEAALEIGREWGIGNSLRLRRIHNSSLLPAP